MSDEATAEVEKVNAVPFNDDMTKAEMIDHLLNVHGIRYIGNHDIGVRSPKATKDEMTRAHERLHKVLDHPDAYESNHGTIIVNQSDGRYHEWEVQRPSVPHIHTRVEASEDDKQRVSAAKSGERISDKPLSQSERKVLLELVNNDFGATAQQMKEMAADELNRVLEEIKQRHSGNKAAENHFRNEYAKVMRTAHDKISDLEQNIRDQGITLTRYSGVPDPSNIRVDFKYEAYDKEVARAREENKQMLNRALMTLERQRLSATRRVLLSGVTEESAKLLDELPTAQELMVEAAQTTTKRIDA